jgi:nucleotide-binding universal stress UspA family protein
MKRILIAVDDTKTTAAVISTFQNSVSLPEKVVLLHVERLAGRSLIIDMLGEAELSTLKESLEGTEYKEKLDRKAEKILAYYKKELQNKGFFNIATMVRAGHSAEEILKVADEEKVDMILLGSHGQKGFNRVFTGSIASDVEKKAKVPVLVAKRPYVCEESYSWKDAFAAITVTSLLVIGMVLIGIIH